MALLAATNNAHKVTELRAILVTLGIQVATPAEIGGIPEVDETGDTFAANAILKATAIANATGYTVFADDSGLEVAALGGAPGVYSARYAATDAARIARLLRALAGQTDRAARFVCVIAIASPAGLIGTAEGEVRGHIADAPRGHRGFGYDPVFVPAGHTQTFAELPPGAKDQISHRARALAAAVDRGLFTIVQQQKECR